MRGINGGTRTRALLFIGGGLAAMALAGTACGASASGSVNTGASPSPAAASSSLGERIASLTGSVKSAKTSTFKAVYSGTGSDGKAVTMTIEQSPPKSYISFGTGEFINTGTATYACSQSGGQTICIKSNTSVGSGQPLMNVFSPDTVAGFMDATRAEVAAHEAGVNVNFSSETFAGEASTCLTVSGGTAQQDGKYCVTSSGILAAVITGSDNFILTSFSTSVSASDFELPAGATVQSY